MIWVQLALTGVATGAIYALAGMGVVLTYKATGVFNFAHGAIAVLAAYVYWQLAGETSDGGWGWPVGLAALVAVFVLGPLLGGLLEVAVFRPLHRSGASTTEKLVATVGAFVLVIGVVVAVWTFEVRQVPSLFGTRPLKLGSDLVIGIDQLTTVLVAAAICVGVWALFRFTHLGTEIRAVVDRRELAELAAVNADRVSALAWMMGTTLSALTGVLLAAQSITLNPYDLTLLVIETFSIAVVARLTSLPVAVGAGVLLLGVGGSLLADPRVSLLGGRGFLGETFDDIKPNLSVVLLFAALLLYRRLDTPADDERAVVISRPTGSQTRTLGLAAATALVLLAVPFFLDLSGFAYAHRMLAMIVIFASIVAITGFAGQLTLGQTGFAGLGGFVTARLVNSFDLPVVVAMVGGGLVAMAAGLLVGYPAVRRRGLFLGLTTLAVALLLSRFVFENDRFAGGSNGLQLDRPSLFGIDLSGDRAFYFFELAVVGIALLLTRNLRAGRLGRALAAMRDSEVGARSVGLDLRVYKLFIFSVSAFLAGIGGALLVEQAGSFQFRQFQPVLGLFWFAAVVVAGVGSVFGAVLAGVLFVLLDVVAGTEGVSQLAIGFAALTLGLLPGGSLLGLARHGAERARSSWERFTIDATARAARDADPPRFRPTPEAVRRLAANGRRR